MPLTDLGDAVDALPALYELTHGSDAMRPPRSEIDRVA